MEAGGKCLGRPLDRISEDQCEDDALQDSSGRVERGWPAREEGEEGKSCDPLERVEGIGEESCGEEGPGKQEEDACLEERLGWRLERALEEVGGREEAVGIVVVLAGRMVAALAQCRRGCQKDPLQAEEEFEQRDCLVGSSLVETERLQAAAHIP